MGLWKFLLKFKKFLNSGARKIHFPKYKKHFKSCFLHLLSTESYFLKYRKFIRVSVSRSIKKFSSLKRKEFFWDFCFLKYNNSFLSRKYIFFDMDFFYFSSLGIKGSRVAAYYITVKFFLYKANNKTNLDHSCQALLKSS